MSLSHGTKITTKNLVFNMDLTAGLHMMSYAKVLSATEIRQNFNAARGRYCI
jgi:hypothetical protein